MNRSLVLLGDSVVDAVVGYRFWKVAAKEGHATLSSLHVGQLPWPKAGPLEALCLCRGRAGWLTEDGRVPVPGACKGTCGVYAWDIPKPAITTGALVQGEVHLWGEVHVHEKGYRADWAKPACLYVHDAMPFDLRMRVELAAKQYDIPMMHVKAPPNPQPLQTEFWRR